MKFRCSTHFIQTYIKYTGKTDKSRHGQGKQTKLTTSTNIYRRTTPEKEHKKPWGIYTQGVSGKQDLGTIRVHMVTRQTRETGTEHKNTSK